MFNFPIYHTNNLILSHITNIKLSIDHFTACSCLESVSDWLKDQEVCKYNSHGKLFYPDTHYEDFYKNIDWSKNIILGVFLKSTKIHIGNIALVDINWIDRTAEFSCVFGNKRYWEKGYCTEATKILFEHGFNKLNLNKIWLGTAMTNLGMNRVACKLGMQREGILEKHVFLEGKYTDVIRYRIFKDEWNNA